MNEEKKGYEPIEEKNTAMLEAKEEGVIKQREEKEIMGNDTQGTARESHPMLCISQAISNEEKIQKAISVIENKVSILLVPSSPVPDDGSGDKDEVRSPLITEFGILHLQQIESLDMLESLAARLDL